MASTDPITRFIDETVEFLSRFLGADRLTLYRLMAPPPRRDFGDYSVPLQRFLRGEASSIDALVETLRGWLWERGIRFAEVEYVNGYLNFRFNAESLASLVFNLQARGWRPSMPKTRRPETIVVEHTSANPIHPLHMGHARNASIGDTLARMLAARGHRVNTRFYIDDVGRQTAVASLGFRLAGATPRELASKMGVKADHAVGWVYAVTHSAIDAVVADRRISRGEGSIEDERERDSALAALSRLKDRGPGEVFEAILSGVRSLEDPQEAVSEIMRRYERGLEPERSLIREIASAVIEGFRETLGRLGVSFDAWDWESDLVWEGLVSRLVEEARRSRYYTTHKEAEAIDVWRVVEEILAERPDLRRAFKLPRGFRIPPLILVRSDGTTLYTTRDIAYSVFKFQAAGADRVVNVIGSDQRLAQLQIRLALLALGREREAVSMIHYEYERVYMPGGSMRSRRGEYVSLDDVIEDAKKLAVAEVERRNRGASREWIEGVAEKVAVGAIRFSLVQVSASRPITLRLENMLNLEENSGPYLQYTHARASSILEKHGPIDYALARPSTLEEGKRRDLLVEALRYPQVAAKAADDMAPEDLASYLLKLADQFNSWYQEDSVIHEPDPGARNAKACLVRLVKDVLHDGLMLLGVEPLERM